MTRRSFISLVPCFGIDEREFDDEGPLELTVGSYMKVCFAHLEDISKEPERKVIKVESNSEFVTPPGSPLPARAFLPKSRRFKRGRTLQELIAPKTLYFYDSMWNEIGEKGELEKEISEITGIDSDVLYNYKLLYTKSTARETTRN